MSAEHAERVTGSSGARRGSIRAVLFDWYGTLVPLAPLDAACEAVAPGRGAEFAARWRARQLEASWLRTIIGRWADFDVVTAEALDVTLAESNYDVSDANKRALVGTFLDLPVRRDARTTLAELRKRGLVTGILSNGTRATLQRGVSLAGLDVGHVLSADDVRCFKPHPSVYRQAVDTTDLSPAEIGFVTANGWDAAGASAFGFRVLWLRPDDSVQPPAVGGPPLTVGSWMDVLSLT